MGGTVANVPPQGGRKHPYGDSIQIDNRTRTKSNRDRVGADLINDLEPDDLVKYGLIPEFIGRMPVSAILEPLNAKALESILTEPRDALVKQFRTLLSMDNVELSFDENAVKAIA